VLAAGVPKLRPVAAGCCCCGWTDAVGVPNPNDVCCCGVDDGNAKLVLAVDTAGAPKANPVG
jgi:hypothetical protein